MIIIFAEYKDILLFGMAFILMATSIVTMIFHIKNVRSFKTGLDELRKVRSDIHYHAPIRATPKNTYEQRLKVEYDKRGLPWVTPGK